MSYRRVNMNTLRKWFMNFMVIDNDIDESTVNFIEGRSPVDVGTANYLHKTKKADRDYSKVEDKFPISP